MKPPYGGFIVCTELIGRAAVVCLSAVRAFYAARADSLTGQTGERARNNRSVSGSGYSISMLRLCHGLQARQSCRRSSWHHRHNTWLNARHYARYCSAVPGPRCCAPGMVVPVQAQLDQGTPASGHCVCPCAHLSVRAPVRMTMYPPHRILLY